MIRRSGIVLIHLCQLGLVLAIYQAQNYYANHLGFMRNVSFYTKKIANGPVGRVIDYVSLLLLLAVLAKIFQLWQKNSLGNKAVSWGVLLVLCTSFVCWQWLFSPLSSAIYYFVSAGIFIAIFGQLGVLSLGIMVKKNK